MTPKEAMQQVREALGLEWVSDEQPNKAVTVVEKLAADLTDVGTALMTIQTLWVSSRDPQGKDRACIQRHTKAFEDNGLSTLAQAEKRVPWAQVISIAALRLQLDKDEHVAEMLLRLASPSEWLAMDGRMKRLIGALIGDACRREIVFGPLGGSTPSNEIEPLGLSSELNILWWGQSLYSPNRLCSYRDIENPSLQLLCMAEDLASLASQQASGPTTAFLLETLRRLMRDAIDQRAHVSKHMSDLLNAHRNDNTASAARILPPPLMIPALLKSDPTGLPFTFALEQAQTNASIDQILNGIALETGLPLDQEVSTRTFAQWLFRERSFIHWLRAEFPPKS